MVMRRRSSSQQFLVKILASYTDKPRLLLTILSFNIEAFGVRNSDICPYEADRNVQSTTKLTSCS